LISYWLKYPVDVIDRNAIDRCNAKQSIKRIAVESIDVQVRGSVRCAHM